MANEVTEAPFEALFSPDVVRRLLQYLRPGRLVSGGQRGNGVSESAEALLDVIPTLALQGVVVGSLVHESEQGKVL